MSSFHSFTWPNPSSFPHLGRTGAGQSVGSVMTDTLDSAITPREPLPRSGAKRARCCRATPREFSKRERKNGCCDAATVENSRLSSQAGRYKNGHEPEVSVEAHPRGWDFMVKLEAAFWAGFLDGTSRLRGDRHTGGIRTEDNVSGERNRLPSPRSRPETKPAQSPRH